MSDQQEVTLQDIDNFTKAESAGQGMNLSQDQLHTYECSAKDGTGIPELLADIGKYMH